MALFDLGPAVALLSPSALTIETRAAGTFDASGRFVPGAATTASVQASVQPIPGKQVTRLPEGLRTREGLQIFTPGHVLAPSSSSALTDGDVAIYEGRRFVVAVSKDWIELGGYGEALAVSERER